MSEPMTCGRLAGTVDAEGKSCELSRVVPAGPATVPGTDPPSAMWEAVFPFDVSLVVEEFGGFAHCPGCGARLSFDAAGKPVAQAMVPAEEADKLRRALEWLAEEAGRQQADSGDCLRESCACKGVIKRAEINCPALADGYDFCQALDLGDWTPLKDCATEAYLAAALAAAEEEKP